MQNFDPWVSCKHYFVLFWVSLIQFSPIVQLEYYQLYEDEVSSILQTCLGCNQTTLTVFFSELLLLQRLFLGWSKEEYRVSERSLPALQRLNQAGSGLFTAASAIFVLKTFRLFLSDGFWLQSFKLGFSVFDLAISLFQVFLISISQHTTVL